ncbi:protein tyrosine phosphatase [Mactra antiquata]
METENATEKTLNLQISLQKFIDHVEELTGEDDPTGDGFTREFKVIRDLGLKMREENTYPADEGKKPCNIKKNRYKDILPFDTSRVILDVIPGEDGSDYINANFIQDLNGYNSYIASQGPVALTVYDFLRMILQYKVKVVVMACRTIEMGKRKCEEYWPSEVNETMQLKDLSITLLSVIEIAEHCTRRELRISKTGQDSLNVTQFHYTGWPDHDIPNDFDVILEMMAEMREIKKQDSDKAPVVVHCSAGCGRTGTICAIDYSWDLLKSGNLDENFSLYDIVINMRQQRQSMIQAPEQYRMAHITVQTLFQKHLDMMEDHTYGNFNFGDMTEENEQLGDSIYSAVSEAGSDTSSLGAMNQYKRKDSSLSHEIASTLALATQSTAHEELMTPIVDSPPANLDEPLTPTPAVYVAEPLSPAVKDLRSKFMQEESESNKSFQVVKIDNIPTGGVEKRYLDSVNKQEAMDRKLSYMPSENKQKELESKKKLFENGQKPSQEQAKAYVVKSTESNTNKPILPAKRADSFTKPSLERIHSTQTDNKHVTVLNVGGIPNKPAVKQTVSAPQGNVPVHTSYTKSTTLPSKLAGNPYSDIPQSSVPPMIPPSQSRDSAYSYAGNSSLFTTSSNDYSTVKNSNMADNKTANGMSSDAYSLLSTYQSGSYHVSASDPYSTVDEGQGSLSVKSQSSKSSQEYSYATNPVPDAVYSSVVKNEKMIPTPQNADGAYESISVGNSVGDKVPPPIPNRCYIEEDSDKAGDTNTLGRKAQLTSAIKNLFTGKGQNSNADVVPSDIPTYMVKIGRAPKGPRQQPLAWKKH